MSAMTGPANGRGSREDRRKVATAATAGGGAGWLAAPGRHINPGGRRGRQAGVGPALRDLPEGRHMVDAWRLQPHTQGTSVRFGEKAHIARMATDMRDKGWKSGAPPVRLSVYRDRAIVNEGNHRAHAAALSGHVTPGTPKSGPMHHAPIKVPVEVRRSSGEHPAMQWRAGQLFDAARGSVQRRRYKAGRHSEAWTDAHAGRGPKPGSWRARVNEKLAASGAAEQAGKASRPLKPFRRGRYLAANAGIIGGGALAAGSVQHQRNRRVGKALGFGTVGALTGGGALAAASGRKGAGREEEAKETLGGLAGGWAAQGAYQGAGYAAKHRADALTPKWQRLTVREPARDSSGRLVRTSSGKRVTVQRTMRRADLPDTRQKKLFDAHSRERQAHYREHRKPVDRHRNTPQHWAQARTRRALGWTHAGKTGTALGTALTAGGTYAGAELASSHKKLVGGNARGRRQQVDKADRSYGYMERKRDPLRTAQLGAGLALGAWGVPRLRMLGPTAGHGLRLAARHGGGKEAARAVELARQAGKGMRQVTGHGEAQLRRIRQVNRAVEAVPANLRPAVATTAGALLAAKAVPTHDERFVPTRRYF